jgi:GNAT superfamily N-acetyltransferase
MSVIRRTLGENSPAPTVVLRAPEPGDLGWVVERHGARYCAEYGWGSDFEALAARIVADFADSGGQGSAAWIAEIDGRRAGCVFCTPASDPATAQLRLLLVEPWARGAGVGTRLVDECLRFAKRAGYRRIMLWTNDVLTSARRIYVRAGFTLDRSEPHDHFGENLMGEYWSRDL